MKIYSFLPISNKNSKVLILGTMPGIASLELNQYYGHPRNAFWKLLFSILDEPFSLDYEVRKQIAIKNNIAIWDVLQACVREGSLDSNIKHEIPNDFELFFKEHPNIELIVFNGQKAAQFFKKYVNLADGYKQVTVPSTSPANAGISWEQKLKEWKVVSCKL
ncbi:DNA-deoxyinosine glycosylase [Flavobacterium ponti]|uniref:DNA-deoxyinosine glycosylase n=1 Tax=Flavobacterium ponti TaxID=665133 RepID=A0ABV9P6L5_9FLAO